MNKFFLLGFLLFVNVLVFAQQKGTLMGVVTEESTGETLIAASIRRVDDLSQGTKTDLYGNYSMQLEPGSYQFICSFLTLATDTFSVVIKAGETTIKNVELFEITKLIETIVVSTSRYEQKLEEQVVTLEVLKPSVIENRNSTTIDGALETVPGVSIIDGDPQIRGGSGFTFGVGSRVAIVVDGMPLLSGDAGKPEWAYIPVENIEQIEIIKGASSVLYGSSALNGVINVRTAYPRSKPKTVINYSVGHYSSPKAPAENWYGNSIPGFTNLNFMHSRIIKKRLDFVIGANLNVDQGYIGPAPKEKDIDPIVKEALSIQDSIPTYSNNDMIKYRLRVNFNLRYRSEKVKGLLYGINGNMMYNKSNLSFAWLDDSLGMYRSYPGALFMQTQKLFNFDPFVRYVSKNGIIHNLNSRIFHSDNYISNNQSNRGTLFYGEYQLRKHFKEIDLNFTGGLVGNFSTSFAELYAESGKPLNQNKNYSAYVQMDKKIWKIINLSGGIRFEYFKMNDNESEIAPIVRAGANVQLSKGTFVRTSFGQGFRYPTITERYILTKAGLFGVFPNPDLQSEKSNTYEIGFKQGFKLGELVGYLDVAGFYQKYDNMIEYLFGVWNPEYSLVGFKFLNTGPSRVRGIETSIMAMTPEKNKFGVMVLLGYTHVNAKSLDPDYVFAVDKSFSGNGAEMSYNTTSINPSDRTLKYRFKHMVKGDIDFRYGDFRLGFTYRYYSKMENIDKAIADIEDLTTGATEYFYPLKTVNFWKNNLGYHIFDVRFSYEINKNHKISLICNNLLNHSYTLRPMKIEAPRTTSIQYIVTL